ncbi:MAG TPA: ACT domain-containing protein [Thermoanaerobaculia bacterium]|nr:ACT domain-containing protein [Thermoanaerobaculia bacterium]
MSLTLSFLPGRFAVCRLGAHDAVPDWAGGAFVSITRTEDELSIVCDESSVPDDVQAERGWTCLKVLGPLPFEMVGVAAALTAALAAASVSVIVVGTFDTDYLLVKEALRAKAIAALEGAGFCVAPPPSAARAGEGAGATQKQAMSRE